MTALAVSAVGLGVAGAASLSTGAETTESGTVATRPPQVAALPLPAPTPRMVSRPTPPAVAAAFGRRDAAAEMSSNPQLRGAVVHERAAQRSEQLSKDAEEIARAGRRSGSAARRAELRSADRAIQAVAVRLAEQRRKQAEEARRAAERARERAEAERAEDEARADSSDAAPQDSGSSGSSSSSSSSGGSTDSGSSGDSGGSGDDSGEGSERSSESDSDSGSGSGGGGGSSSPVAGAVIGSYFGQYGVWARYHTGLDFRAAHGTPIKAVKSGKVLYAGNSGTWAGNHVAIKHADGKTTLSAHMSSMSVSSGESVAAGEVIGYVGQTGRAFGAHLHFELYPPGVKYGDVYSAINPKPWLANNGVATN